MNTQNRLLSLFNIHPGEGRLVLLVLLYAILLYTANVLAIIMRPDQQDYEGTGVTVEVARSLDVPRMLLIVNKTPPAFDPAEVRARVEQTYGCEVAAVLPHSDEMMTLASTGIFALHYPDHPLTALLRQVVTQLVA